MLLSIKCQKKKEKKLEYFLFYFIIFSMNMTHFRVLRSAFMYAWVKIFQDYSWIQDFEADFP